MNEFLIGCTHFGHEKIITLAERPFSNSREMDEHMIAEWNKTVGLRDTVYHLGDFAWGNNAKYMSRLNGRIITLQGNHDPKGWGEHYMIFKRDGMKVILCHYPIEEWDGWYRGAVHFHCHTHKKEFQSAKRRGNVGVDAIGFAPIELSDAIARLKMST